MAEDKDKVRERVRKYRSRKKAPSGVGVTGSEVSPRAGDLVTRVSALEIRVKKLEAVRSPLDKVVEASMKPKDLYSSVIEEKLHRLGG